MVNTSEARDRDIGPGAVALAVFVTAIAGIVVFLIALSLAKDWYRAAHNLPRVRRGFWIFETYEPAPVTLEQLGVEIVVLLVAGSLMYALFVHPIIGRLLTELAHSLAQGVDTVYRLGGRMADWNPEFSLFFGAAWPVTALTIPFLLIALVSGRVYRALWR